MKETFTIRNTLIAVIVSTIISSGILIAVSGVETDAQHDVENPANPVDKYVNLSTSKQRIATLLFLYGRAESRQTGLNSKIDLLSMDVRARIIGELREEYRLQEQSLYR